MKTILIAAALLTVSALPALAGEGQGDPFAIRTPGVTTQIAAEAPETDSEAYPVVAGRPGTNFGVFASDAIRSNAKEASVQSASSLPVGAENGNLTYAQLRPAVPLITAAR